MGIVALALLLQDPGQVYNQPTGGDRLVVMEAENALGNVTAAGHTWTLANAGTATVAPAGFVGDGAMGILPNNGSGGNTGATTFVNGARLDFRVLFRTTGVHHVWIRGRALSGTPGSNDSCHVAINGQPAAAGFEMSGWGVDTEWRWSRTRTGGTASVNVTSLGVHVISVYMREDGLLVDRILLTTNTAYAGVNNPITVAGPAETGQIADQTPPAATAPVVVGGSFRFDVSWAQVANADTYILEKSANNVDFLPVFSGPGLTYSEENFDTTHDYYFRVRGVDSVFGSGPVSPSTSGRAQLPPPRTAGHEEGLLDENCACGSTVRRAPAWAGAVGLLLLLAALRRR